MVKLYAEMQRERILKWTPRVAAVAVASIALACGADKNPASDKAGFPGRENTGGITTDEGLPGATFLTPEGQDSGLPAFSLENANPNFDGDIVSLKDFRGKILLVAAFQERPEDYLRRLNREVVQTMSSELKESVTVLAVITGRNLNDARKIVQRSGDTYSFPILADPSVPSIAMDELNGNGLPAYIVVNAEGKPETQLGYAQLDMLPEVVALVEHGEDPDVLFVTQQESVVETGGDSVEVETDTELQTKIDQLKDRLKAVFDSVGDNESWQKASHAIDNCFNKPDVLRIWFPGAVLEIGKSTISYDAQLEAECHEVMRSMKNAWEISGDSDWAYAQVSVHALIGGIHPNFRSEPTTIIKLN